MDMLSPDLRDKLGQFLDGMLGIEELEEWIVARLRVFMEPPDTPDASVVAAIELGLAEMSDGIRSEAQFRDLMRHVLLEHSRLLVVFLPVPESRSETYSANQTANILVSTAPAATLAREGLLVRP